MKLSYLKKNITLIVCLAFLNVSCGKDGKLLPGADARKFPADPKQRVENNLKEGRGFQLNKVLENKGGVFDFASSNELWRASLDTIDFMPLLSANYSGGIIITDWYSENQNDSIKITVRFLTNEIRSDAIDIKVFYKKCNQQMNCTISEQEGNIEKELKKQILRQAAIYQKQNKDKDFKPYSNSNIK